jgi:nucleolar complex protein 3
VLYFRILKSPRPTALLPAALQGISRYAHLVSIDFFKDLLGVLRDLVTRNDAYSDSLNEPGAEAPIDSSSAPLGAAAREQQDPEECTQHRLRCIITAFELLSGQGKSALVASHLAFLLARAANRTLTFLRKKKLSGEALNVDLADFVNSLYGLLLSASLLSAADLAGPAHLPGAPSSSGAPRTSDASTSASTSDLLFRALELVFAPRGGAAAPPAWRAAAFAKRLLAAALSWPARAPVLRALRFVVALAATDARLRPDGDAPEDRVAGGAHRPLAEDPQLANALGAPFWELHVLAAQHADPAVRRAAAGALAGSAR